MILLHLLAGVPGTGPVCPVRMDKWIYLVGITFWHNGLSEISTIRPLDRVLWESEA